MNFKSTGSSLNLIFADIFKYFFIVIALFLPSSLFATQIDRGSSNKTFYISNDGDYSIRAYLKPNRTFMSAGAVNTAIETTAAVFMDTISGWNISSNSSTDNKPTVIIDEDGLHVDAQEDVTLTKEFPDIKLKENPYMTLSYDVQNSDVQDVIVYILFEDDDGMILSESLMRKPAGKTYSINLYEESGKVFNKDIDIDELYIAKVSIICERKAGIGVSNTSIKDNYIFTIKNLVFLKHEPILINFETPLLDLRPARYYYVDGNKNRKEARFFDEIPDYVKTIYSTESQKFVNLKDSPVLTFSFFKPALPKDWERSGVCDEIKVLSVIDFDGDGEKDAEMEMIVPPPTFSLDRNSPLRLLVNMSVYEKVKEMFPDKRGYNLLGLSICRLDEDPGFYQKVESKKLIRYEEYKYKMPDLKIKSDMMRIDGKIHELSFGYKRYEKDNYAIIESNGIRFGEGYHVIEFKDDERFRVVVMEIKPLGSKQLKVNGQMPPLIEFKKINPTRYVVDVKGATRPFTLVFSESFHEGWKAYKRQKSEDRSQKTEENQKTIEPRFALLSAWKDRGNRIEIKDHFMVNGYANGWIVDSSAVGCQPSAVGGQQSFQIVLEYKPQRLFEIGLIISMATFLGCIGYLGYDFMGRRKSVSSRQGPVDCQ